MNLVRELGGLTQSTAASSVRKLSSEEIALISGKVMSLDQIPVLHVRSRVVFPEQMSKGKYRVNL